MKETDIAFFILKKQVNEDIRLTAAFIFVTFINVKVYRYLFSGG